ncbi:MAG TPA: DUF6531 domain-containing protein [Pseudobdellovibrionaceae bacterium]
MSRMKTFLLWALFIAPLTGPFSAKADVNMKDASYFKTWIDLEIRKDTHIFQLRRTYNSRSLHPGLFGFGWCSDFEKSLDLNRSDQILLQDCRLNAPIRFKKIKENLYESPNKETLELKENHYLRTTTEKTFQKYNKLGKLLSLIDTAGDHLDLSYSGNGFLQKIIFKDIEQNINFDLNHRHIQVIKSKNGQEISYRYENNNLTQVNNSWKNIFLYSYDEFHNLTRIQAPQGGQEVLTYDAEKDWILRIDSANGTLNKCAEIFHYYQKKDMSYVSTAEKRCAGKSIAKTIYEFRYRKRADGSKYLEQVNVTQGNKIQRISYQNKPGLLNESP